MNYYYSNYSNIEFKKSDLKLNRNRQFASALFLCIVNIYTIYVIVFNSKKRLGIYRWFQLDMVVSAFFLFLYISLFWTPFLLFPTLGCCTTGLLSIFKYYWVSNTATVTFFICFTIFKKLYAAIGVYLLKHLLKLYFNY